MMSREIGSNLSEFEHIKQSIQDIISTPLGSRIMRRSYGTQLFNLIDQPTSEALYLKIYSTIYSSILQWENRIDVSQININSLSAGQMVIDLEFTLTKTGQAQNLNIPVSIGATP